MEVTEYLNYASTASQLAVRVASTFDDFEGAIRVLEQALLHEPNGSQLRIFAVDYLEALDDELGSRGQSERLTRIKGSTEYQNLISDELLQELMR